MELTQTDEIYNGASAVESVPVRRAPQTSPLLEVCGLGVTFGKEQPHRVLSDVTFEVGNGEFVCLVGPSGAGKTTLLRCIAGLQAPSDGQVRLSGSTVDQPPADLAVVFQDYSRSLMPWLSVMSNVTLPLEGQGVPRSQRRDRAAAALEAVGLLASASQYPWQLSGGMQQRVAIARALACQPKALLMDEPFASVDAQTRADLEDLALSVQREFGVTTILVTHDIDEAVYLADRVIAIGGRPTTIQDVVRVDLGPSRDQVSTKSMPRFAELRARVYCTIRGQSDRPGSEVEG